MEQGDFRQVDASWIPGVVAGAITGLGPKALSWFMGTAKRDAQVEAALKNHTEISQVKETAADERNFDLREDLKDLRDQLRLAVAEMHSVASETARLQASQDVVNKVTAKALEAIETKMDKHEQAISDHAATLRLVTELLTKRNTEVPKG